VLQAAGRKTHSIGIDLGGTKIEIAVVGDTSAQVEHVHLATGPAGEAERTLQELIDCLKEKFPTTPGSLPVAVGVGVAGQVNPSTGVVQFAPNLRWRNVPLRAPLERALAVPVKIMNDVHAATYGEWLYGAGRGHDDLVCLFVGTGIGGGVVSGGRFLMGHSGSAGELGHMTIDLAGPLCSCGNRGCLEAFTGGWAIANLARLRLRAEPEEGPWIRRLTNGDLGTITAQIVSEAASHGDTLAQSLQTVAGRALGVGLANMINAFNPARIILGGGVMAGMPELLAIAEREAKSRALKAPLREIEIVKAELGPLAGAIGAAARARDLIRGAPNR